MDHIKKLFKGRINRRSYFNGSFALTILDVVLIYFLSHLISEKSPFTSGFSFIRYFISNSPIKPSEYIFFPLLLTMIFSLSLLTRRFHDLGKSGLYSLLMFIPGVYILVQVYLLIKKGQEKDNKYGVKPSKKISFPGIKIPSFFLLIPAAIAAFFIFLIVSFYVKYGFSTLQNPFKYFLPTAKSTIPITAPSTETSTANWKTLSNFKDYSFKYPNQWYLKDRQSSTGRLFFFEIGATPVHSKSDLTDNPTFIVTDFTGYNYFNIEKTGRNEDGSSRFVETIVGDKRALKSIPRAGSFTEVYLLIGHLKNGNDHILNLQVTSQNDRLLLDQILSTFEFTN